MAFLSTLTMQSLPTSFLQAGYQHRTGAVPQRLQAAALDPTQSAEMYTATQGETAPQFASGAAPSFGAQWLLVPIAAVFGFVFRLAMPQQSIAMAPATGRKRDWFKKYVLGADGGAPDMNGPKTMDIIGDGLDRLGSIGESQGGFQPRPKQAPKSFPSMVLRQRVDDKKFAQRFPKFDKVLQEAFPGAMHDSVFLAKMTKYLNAKGFDRDNSIVLISTCRDEISRPFADDCKELWGETFFIGSLAGMVFCGKTGMMAGMTHAPVCPDGLERYVFLSAPHIAISEEGAIGACKREGRPGLSGACGALQAFQGELSAGTVNVTVDTLDIVQSMMKQQLSAFVKYGDVPALEDLTKAAQKCIKSQLEGILAELDMNKTEYAFVSGVQIHGPDNENFFWPTDLYLRRRGGEPEVFPASVLKDVDAGDIIEGADQGDLAKVMFVVQQGDEESVKRWLTEEGGDVNAQDPYGRTALQVSSRYGHEHIVKLLLEAGANPRIYSNSGRGALQEAVRHGHDSISQLLRSANPTLQLPYEVSEFYLWRAAREGNLPLAIRAVMYGPENVVNCRHADGDSPLFAAVRCNNREVARYFVSVGADPLGVDLDGNTIATVAQRRAGQVILNPTLVPHLPRVV